MLDLLRENRAAVEETPGVFAGLVGSAHHWLKILDPGHGEEALIQSVAAELAMIGTVEPP